MRYSVVVRVVILCATASLAHLEIQAQEVVKWTDENGVVHFGASPPPGHGASEKVNVPPTNAMVVPSNTGKLKAARSTGSRGAQSARTSGRRSATSPKPRKRIQRKARKKRAW